MADKHAIEQSLAIMAKLRDPDSGCPWDLKQDFKSIVPHTLEEAYEVADCIEKGELTELKSELGDLLFATVNVARHIKRDPEQLLRSANAKFASRFEKVAAYLDERGQSLETASLEEMDSAWEAIKKQAR